MTRGLHVGFRARDRAQVDAFWQAGIDAGYQDDGAPGPRTHYGPRYYGGFLLDPDGNSVEAVHGDGKDTVPAGVFCGSASATAGLPALLHDDRPARQAPPDARRAGRVQLSADYSFSLVRDERPLSRSTSPRIPARDLPGARVPRRRARGGLLVPRRAGRARGLPPENRHGAFVLDPDGHNVGVVNHNLSLSARQIAGRQAALRSSMEMFRTPTRRGARSAIRRRTLPPPSSSSAIGV